MAKGRSALKKRCNARLMKMKWPCAFLVFFIASLLFGVFYNKKPNWIPLVFDEEYVPYFHTNIGKKRCVLRLETGTDFPLQLDETILYQLNKKQIGYNKLLYMDGSIYLSPVYKTSDIILTGLRIPSLKVAEMDPNDKEEGIDGIVGGKICDYCKLCFDFPNGRLIRANSLKDLERLEISLNGFVGIPYVKERVGILFHGNTSVGDTRIHLNTGSKKSLIAASLCDEKKLRPTSSYLTSFIEINGNKEPLILKVKPFGSFTQWFDISLGMDFLKDYQIYVDYETKTVFFKKEQDPS